MIRFENDSIDESEEMKDVIQEGKTLLRMRVRTENVREEICTSWLSAQFLLSTSTVVVVMLFSSLYICCHSIQRSWA